MSGIINSIQSIAGKLGSTFQNVLDIIAPPEKRAEMFSKLQEFATNNPKLAAFLIAQITFTGLPLLLFFTFSLTVFLFSVIATLLIGLVAALLFTVLMVGIALIVVLPIIFLTTFTASFFFLWGLGGYLLATWFAEGYARTPEGTAVGDKINNLTGGRMSWLMDGARKRQDDKRTGINQTLRIHSSESNGIHEKLQSNGDANGEDVEPARLPTKHAEMANSSATEQADGAQKRVTTSTGWAASAAGNGDGDR